MKELSWIHCPHLLLTHSGLSLLQCGASMAADFCACPNFCSPSLMAPTGVFQTPRCLGRTCLPPLPDTCSFFFKYLHGILQCWKFLCISHPLPCCDLKWPKRTCDLKQRYLACACLMDGSVNMYTADCQIYTYPSSFNGFLKYTFKNVLNI